MDWYNVVIGKRSIDDVTNDHTIGIGRRVHELRFVNGITMDKAIDAVSKVNNYMDKNQIIEAYHKHLNKTLSNGVEDPYEEAFMKSEINKKTSNKWYEFNKTATTIKQKINDVENIFNSGYANSYFTARNGNISHDNYMEAMQVIPKSSMMDYAKAGSVASHKQLMDVNNQGYKLKGYSIARLNGLGHAKTINLLKQKVPIVSYSEAFKSGANDSEIKDAMKKKVNMKDYSYLRAHGIWEDSSLGYKKINNHKESVEVLSHPEKIDIYDYNTAKESNATHKEFMDIVNKFGNNSTNDYANYRWISHSHDSSKDLMLRGIEYEDYHSLINSAFSRFLHNDARNYNDRNPISHKDIIDFSNRGYDVKDLAQARMRCPLSYADALDLQNKNVNVLSYSLFKNAGFDHDESIKILKKGIDAKSYLQIRSEKNKSITHDEAIDALNHGIKGEDAIAYPTLRKSLDHNTIIDLYNNGIPLKPYSDAVECGATKIEMNEVKKLGVNVQDYADLRSNYGTTHEDSLNKLVPNYNPYKNLFGSVKEWYK